MGLIPELHRAWFTVDSRLFVAGKWVFLGRKSGLERNLSPKMGEKGPQTPQKCRQTAVFLPVFYFFFFFFFFFFFLRIINFFSWKIFFMHKDGFF
jgi:hypothetical protein